MPDRSDLPEVSRHGYNVRDLIGALLDLPPEFDGHPTMKAEVQVTIDGDTFFAVESVVDYGDGGVVLQLMPQSSHFDAEQA